MGRKNLLALTDVAVLAACGDDDGTAGGSGAESGGAMAMVQTVVPLEPSQPGFLP